MIKIKKETDLTILTSLLSLMCTGIGNTAIPRAEIFGSVGIDQFRKAVEKGALHKGPLTCSMVLFLSPPSIPLPQYILAPDSFRSSLSTYGQAKGVVGQRGLNPQVEFHEQHW